MEEEKNEFSELDGEFGDDDTAPTQEMNDVPNEVEGQEDIIASGSAGTVYDWNTAPEGGKAPPRIDLNGQEIIINKADIVLPPKDREWDKTRDKKKEFKFCTFVLYYDKEGQQEFYSGVRVFNREGKYSHPSITRDRENQASKLLGAYADYKGKNINEVSLKEFMSFLNSKPKAVIEVKEFENPTTGDKIKKNLVGKFI